jgi:peroxiredoxin (alkyl hydroperoxide reductase subunit C)
MMESRNDVEAKPTPTPMPRIGDTAPDFEAETTHGMLRLSDFAGSWLVLFSHPADFTPVCTTEFIAFAKAHEDLREMNCELLGLSIDSIFAHIAWIRNIEESHDISINFPVIADIGHTVAMKYGMIHPGDGGMETSRCVFVIDDKGVIRALVYYPLTTGRNVPEIVRLVRALQFSDTNKVATPADWQPGDKAIMPPPRTQEEAARRADGDAGGDCVDWYLCRTEVK